VAAVLALCGGWSLIALSARRTAGPQVVSATPASGTGAGQTFSFTYSDPDGAWNILTTEAVIVSGTQLTGLRSCYFYAEGDQIRLRDDANSAWLGPATAGSQMTLSNSQCSVAAGGFSVVTSGSTLVMTVPVTFPTSAAGAKTIYLKGNDRADQSSGWVQGGRWTASVLNPSLDVITSSCADSARDGDLSLDVSTPSGNLRYLYRPRCFPSYSFYGSQEGAFTEDGRALPMMGRTCGAFNVLVAFVDTNANRQKLLDNTTIPAAVKSKIAGGRVKEALTDLFASYSAGDIMSGLRREAASVVSFTFSVGLTSVNRRDMEWGDDGGLGFPNYDAVLVLDDLSPNSGHGVHRWPSLPSERPVYWAGRTNGVVFNIDPFWLQPGLVGNELLRRNIPVLLLEYQFGERTLVTENGVTYDRTPIFNPRTGENIEPLIRANEGKTPIGVYLAGWADVDHDGIIDCVDPEITPTPDNVDGDFIPDRYDPDLQVDHRPYSWMYAARGGYFAAASALKRESPARRVAGGALLIPNFFLLTFHF